jgi:hypothetical protein
MNRVNLGASINLWPASINVAMSGSIGKVSRALGMRGVGAKPHAAARPRLVISFTIAIII